MVMTVEALVNNAYYASGIISRGFETVEGDELTFGVEIFNDILGEKLIDDKYLPYYRSQTVTGVIGQETYFVEHLIEIDTMTFVKDGVRYSMERQNRRVYFGSNRANNVRSLPATWHYERTLGGSNVYVYFLPDQAYTFTIWGKFGLDQTTGLLQDLSLVYDRYYLTFLKYELADRLCAEYEYEVPTGVEKTLAKLRASIVKKSAVPDLELSSISTLRRGGTLNYADVNLGRGWTS